MNARRGFTLIELLVVVGIIALITSASLMGYTKFVRHAQQVRGIELVHQVATAITSLVQDEGTWPRTLLRLGEYGDKLNEVTGAALARSGTYSLTYKTEELPDGSTKYTLSGLDRFGILDPWALDAIKRSSQSAGLNMNVPTGGKVEDHILRCVIDDDQDGIVMIANPEVGSSTGIKVRASVCVWGCGRDGEFGTKDDIKSWTKGMEVLE